jgi:hypothetical protein
MLPLIFITSAAIALIVVLVTPTPKQLWEGWKFKRKLRRIIDTLEKMEEETLGFKINGDLVRKSDGKTMAEVVEEEQLTS